MINEKQSKIQKVITIKGLSPCNSNCIFCIERCTKQPLVGPNMEAFKDIIQKYAGQYDTLGFANGEPTINHHIFNQILYAKQHGFTDFQIVSNFRALSDHKLVLKFLKMGVRYYDLSLHAYDKASSAKIDLANKGESFTESIQGLKNLIFYSQMLNIKIYIAHKIVVNKFNCNNIHTIFTITNNLGVKNFIVQPLIVHSFPPELVKKIVAPRRETLVSLNKMIKLAEARNAKVKLFNYRLNIVPDNSALEKEKNKIYNTN